jgi:uncharacterized protein YggU (UPF0235/DUF167 family)
MSGIAGDLFTIDHEPTATEPGAIVITITLRTGPGATRISGRAGVGLQVQLAAPPGSTRADESCAALLATTLGVERSAVELVGGGGKRDKQFRAKVAGFDDVRRRLDAALGEAATINSGVGGRRNR